MDSAQTKQPEDYAWIAAWSTEWLREQGLQEELLRQRSEEVHTSSKVSKGRGRKKASAAKNRARRQAKQQRAKLKEEVELHAVEDKAQHSSSESAASEPSTQLPSAEEPNLSAESLTGELPERSDSAAHLVGTESVSSQALPAAKASDSALGGTDDIQSPVLVGRTASIGTASVASELPCDPGVTYDQTPSPWSPMRFRPGSRTTAEQRPMVLEEDVSPLVRTQSKVVTVHDANRVTAVTEPVAVPSPEPAPIWQPLQPSVAWGSTPSPWSPLEQQTHIANTYGPTPTPWSERRRAQPTQSAVMYGPTPTPWSERRRAQPTQSADTYGPTPTPSSPIQRMPSESNVWDEAQRSFVEKIMHRNASTPGGLPDLSQKKMQALLWPRGYELPAMQEELLGSGSFGRVVKVSRSRDGQLFAMKRQFLGDFADDIVPVLREIRILNALKASCNIVQIEEAFLARPTSGDSEVWAILEFFPHNLNQLHYQFRHEQNARYVVFQLLLGLNSLHSADIVHRDLKPANVLVDLGQEPPRVAICDFGISRSLHGLPEKGDAEGDADGEGTPRKALHRTVTTHVTSSFWRAPEMWGWADAGRMSKQDLKSLDVFALGLIWAGLLGGGPVITCNEDCDPAKFRLLEILQKVDRPSDHDLNNLFYGLGEKWFIQRLLAGDIQAILSEMVNDEFPDKGGKREQLLRAPYLGIRKWIWKNAHYLEEDSQTPEIIESIAKFSYRARPMVATLLEHKIFADLRASSPPRLWAHKQAPPIDDVREMLDEELRHQIEAVEHHDAELHARPQQGNSSVTQGPDSSFSQEVDKDTADVQASVRRVCDQVRTELDRASRW